MNASELTGFFLWCTLLNYGVLIVWFLAFCLGRRWLYGLHSRWFTVSDGAFDSIHYAGMALYKILVLVFNLAPFLALHIAGAA